MCFVCELYILCFIMELALCIGFKEWLIPLVEELEPCVRKGFLKHTPQARSVPKTRSDNVELSKLLF